MSYEINLVVGNDTGNSEHDIKIGTKVIKKNAENKKNVEVIKDIVKICQPNVIAKVKKKPNLEELNTNMYVDKLEDNLLIDIISNDASTATGTYYCGNSALRSREMVRTIEVGAYNNKADSEIVFINTLAQIASYAVKKAYKEEKVEGTIKVNVDMTGSLPMNQHTKTIANNFADKFMKKIHTLSITIPGNSIKVEIKFEFVKILQEGITTTFALNKADEGLFEAFNLKVKDDKNEFKNVYDQEINTEYFDPKKEIDILHISIGEGTTELPVTHGQKPDPNFMEGCHNGVGHAIDDSLLAFKAQFNLPKFSRQQFSEVIRDTEHKYHVSAMDELEPNLEEQAREILFNAKRELGKANNDVDIIAVYGGGSILMRKSLEPKLEVICEKAKIKLLYINSDYAVTIECDGLFNFTTSEIFKFLKNKAIQKSTVLA